MYKQQLIVLENEEFVDFSEDYNSYCFIITTTARKFTFKMYGFVKCCELLDCGLIESPDTNIIEKQIKTLTLEEAFPRINFIVELPNRKYTFYVENNDKNRNYPHSVELTDDQELVIKTCL